MSNTWQIKNTQLSTPLPFEASGSSVLQLHEWQQFLLVFNSNMSLLNALEQKLALDEAFSGGTIGTVATEAWVEANFIGKPANALLNKLVVDRQGMVMEDQQGNVVYSQ